MDDSESWTEIIINLPLWPEVQIVLKQTNKKNNHSYLHFLLSHTFSFPLSIFRYDTVGASCVYREATINKTFY